MNLQNLLLKKINKALIAIGIEKDFELQIRQSKKIEFGDYQINGIVTKAKKLNIPAQQLAKKILTHLELKNIAKKIEIIDPGFINIFLDPIFLAKHIDKTLKSELLFIKKPIAQTIVVDYSAPNVAKEMHVGHLRSTIIGDAVVRTLELLGHNVIRANHIGDWGTQFGMLIAYLEKKEKNDISKITLTNLDNFYQEAKKHYDENTTFAQLARSYVVKLQRGDTHLIKMWRNLVNISLSKNQIIYDRLNVTLTKNDVMGESLYNSMLPDIVKDLKKRRIAVKSEGAIVVFLDSFKNKAGKPMGVIIQKKDGGYLYTTTDIACAKYRYETFHADRILYYIDSRQHQHLMQAWTIVRQAGYVPNSVSLEHHMFGLILGKNGKPFKTREGNTIKLVDLLDEAIQRAYHLVAKKNPNMPPNELKKLAKVVGVGAVKYADLSINRTTNYVFDWDNMLSFEGNTAPYIQYAYTRILSIFRKISINNDFLANTPTVINEDKELKLAICLLQLEETLNIVAQNGTPHVICSYLYNLANTFSTFYQYCPILKAKSTEIKNSRLKLAQLTAKTLKLGLNILGIETIERM